MLMREKFFYQIGKQKSRVNLRIAAQISHTIFQKVKMFPQMSHIIQADIFYHPANRFIQEPLTPGIFRYMIR